MSLTEYTSFSISVLFLQQRNSEGGNEVASEGVVGEATEEVGGTDQREKKKKETMTKR